ncbi:MAG: tetratricopeptide repeat protein [Limisphaerales bacterium]
METTSAYIARDRREAMARGIALPGRARGTAVFADISGFTPLTEALTQALGPRRGVEELTGHINRVYDGLVSHVHEFGGSIIGFAGDAITCWFDGDDGLRAAGSGLAMQAEMRRLPEIRMAGADPVSLALKVGIAAGEVRRFAVGNPEIQLLDVIAGKTLAEMAHAANSARKGEVVVTATVAARLENAAEIGDWRPSPEAADRCGALGRLLRPVPPAPWPPSPNLPETLVRPWLLPAVHQRLGTGQGEFLTELRPAVALFLKFGGIDYDLDDDAGIKLDGFVRWIQGVLAPYEGFLHHVSDGDKGSYLYCTFGAPIAHEDDADRALSAALELRCPPANLGFEPRPQIGISQGTLRTGAYGGVARRTYGVLGDEVNLAARLMEPAGPGQALVSERTRDAVGDRFAWEAFPPIKLKGKARPVAVFRLIERRSHERLRQFESAQDRPMVGRKAELERFAGLLARVRSGQGQIVEITAEAGMGKSRLALEVLRMARERGFQTLGGQAQSFAANTSYLPWWGVWRAFFDLGENDGLAAQAAALASQLLGMNSLLLPRLPLLGAVVNLAIPENDTTRSLDAKLRKAALEGLLVECVRHRATLRPLVIILEDAHWLDPLSQDLLEVVARSIAYLPVLVLLAARPPEVGRESPPAWRALPHFTAIPLGELNADEAEELIRLKLIELGGADQAPNPDVIHRLVERAQGNPFYLEEIINLLRDEGRNPNDPRAWEGLELPTSLHSLILSRMDRLSERQKPTLKVASVIGRVFDPGTISAIYPSLREPDVRQDLTELERLELTAQERPEPELAFIFKHVVTQEVAYETLPFATRARLHGELGLFTEKRHRNSPDQHLDLLAFHFDRSELEDKRREYLLKAGAAAQARYANAAALSYYRRALPLLPSEERITPQVSIGRVLETLGDWPAAAEAYQAALHLAESHNDRAAQARCLTALADLHRKRGDYPESTRGLDAARALFREVGDAPGVAQTLHIAGSVAAQQGAYDQARALYLESLETRRAHSDDAGVASLLSNLGIIAWFQGDHPEARRLYEESLAIRRRLGDRWAIGNSLNNLGLVVRDLDDPEGARRLLEECLTINREIGDRWSIANSLGSLADIALSLGDHSGAQDFLAENIRINRDLGDRTGLAFSLELSAQLAAAQARPERAFRLAGAATALREAIGAPLSPSEQERLDRTLLAASDGVPAEQRQAWIGAGRNLSQEDAVRAALADDPPAPSIGCSPPS